MLQWESPTWWVVGEFYSLSDWSSSKEKITKDNAIWLGRGLPDQSHWGSPDFREKYPDWRPRYCLKKKTSI